MRNLIRTIFILLLMPSLGMSQFMSNGNISTVPFNTSSHDGFLAVELDLNDNSILAAGYVASDEAFGNSMASYSGQRDGVLAKYDASGTLQWYTYIGGSGNDIITDVSVANTGLIFVTGYFNGSAAFYDANGGGSNFANLSGQNYEAFLACFSPDGGRMWIRSHGGSNNDIGLSIEANNDRIYSLIAFDNASNDIVIDGQPVPPTGSGFIAGYGMMDQGLGTTTSYALLSYDDNGNLNWKSYYGSDEDDIDLRDINLYSPSDIQNAEITIEDNKIYVASLYSKTESLYDADNNYFIDGFQGISVDDDIMYMEYADDGTPVWQTEIYFGSTHGIKHLNLTSDCNALYLSATVDGSEGIELNANTAYYTGNGYDPAIFKASLEDGEIEWSRHIETASTVASHDYISDLSTDLIGNVFFCGSFKSDMTYNSDFAAINQGSLSPTHNTDIFLGYLDGENGQLRRIGKAGETGQDYGNGITADDGSFVIVGSASRLDDFPDSPGSPVNNSANLVMAKGNSSANATSSSCCSPSVTPSAGIITETSTGPYSVGSTVSLQTSGNTDIPRWYTRINGIWNNTGIESTIFDFTISEDTEFYALIRGECGIKDTAYKALNLKPVAVNDTLLCFPSGYGTIPIIILENDIDADMSTVDIVEIATPSVHGTTVIGATLDTLEYTEGGTPAIADSVQYVIQNSGGEKDTAWVFIEFIPTINISADYTTNQIAPTITLDGDMPNGVWSQISTPLIGTDIPLSGDTVEVTLSDGLGEYSYTYALKSIFNTCISRDTLTITLTEPSCDGIITYPIEYYINTGEMYVLSNTSPGGFFNEPSGQMVLDPNTGTIDLDATPVGQYDIIYTVGPCEDTVTFTILEPSLCSYFPAGETVGNAPESCHSELYFFNLSTIENFDSIQVTQTAGPASGSALNNGVNPFVFEVSKSSQVIPRLKFGWNDDSRSVLDSDYGPDAIAADGGVINSGAGMNGGALKASPSTTPPNLLFDQSYFDYEGIYLSFQYAHDGSMNIGSLFNLPNSLDIGLTNGVMRGTIRTVDSGGGVNVTTLELSAISPPDTDFHYYRLAYDPTFGRFFFSIDNGTQYSYAVASAGDRLNFDGSGPLTIATHFIGTSAGVMDELTIVELTLPLVETCGFNVIVEDNEAPTPDNNLTAVFGDCSTVIPVPTATDNCDGGSISATTSDQTTFYANGNYTINWEYEDSSGNTSEQTQTVSISDTEAPTILLPSGGSITSSNDSGLCGAIMTWNYPSITDNCLVIDTTTWGVQSGNLIPVGTNYAYYQVTDASGNITLDSLELIVTDNEDPNIGWMSNLEVFTDPSQCGAVVNWTLPSIDDNCAVVDTLIYDNDNVGAPAWPGEFFPVGNSHIQIEAHDDAGRSKMELFNITITDNEAPYFLSFPNDTTVSAASGDCAAAVSWNLPTYDDNCAVTNVNSSDDPGDDFNVGTTSVTYTVRDEEGNTATQSFTVTVEDNEAPSVSNCPTNFTAPVSASCAYTVPDFTSDPSATDNCSAIGNITITQFPLPAASMTGDFIVTLTATDEAGNTSECNFEITLIDDQAPAITCPGTQMESFNSDCEFVVPDYSSLLSASDNCTATADLDIMQSPMDGLSVFGDFTVTFTVRDESSNSSACSFPVMLGSMPVTLANAGPTSSAICEGETFTLNASTINADSISWNTSGDGVFNDINLEDPIYTPGPTDISSGSVTLAITAHGSGSCASASDIIILEIAPTADAGEDNSTSVCVSGTSIDLFSILNGNPEQGGYWINLGGADGLSGAVFDPSLNAVGAYLFKYVVAGTAPCPNDTSTVTINITSGANAGADNSFQVCETETALNLSSWISLDASASGVYEDVSGSGALIGSIFNVNAAGEGPFTFNYIVTEDGCSNDTAEFIIDVTALVTASAGSNAEQCGSASFNLLGTESNADSIIWTTSGDGTFSVLNSLTPEYIPGTMDLIAESVDLTITAFSDGVCPSDSDEMTLALTPIPVGSAGPDGEVCNSSSFSPSGSGMDYSTILWSTSGDGSFSNGNTLSPVYTPGFNDIAIGTASLTMTLTGNGSCEAFSDMLTLSITPAPSVNAGPAIDVICADPSYALDGTATNFSSLLWESTGDGSFDNDSIEDAVYVAGPNDFTNGGFTLRFTSYGLGSCLEVTDSIVVSITPRPGAPAATSAQNFCSINIPSIADLVPNGPNFIWYDTSSGGSALNYTDLLTDGTTYYVSETTAGCESNTRTAVTVGVTTPAAPPAEASQDFCGINTPTIADLVPNGANFIWYDTSSGGSALNYTDLLTDGTTYYVSETAAGCESNMRTAVNVILAAPDAPLALSPQLFCGNDIHTLESLDVSGQSLIWHTSLSGGTILPSSTPLVDGETYYASQIIAGCESIDRAIIIVDLDDIIEPTAICQDVQLILSSDYPGSVGLDPLQVNSGSFDNCNDASELTFGLDQSFFDCSNQGAPISVTLTVTDESGNLSTCISNVTVLDQTSPEITCAEDITLQADALTDSAYIIMGQPLVIENCDNFLLYNNFNDTEDASDYYPLGTTLINWAIESNGETVTCSHSITVLPATAPSIDCLSEIIVENDAGECGGTTDIELPSITGPISMTTEYNFGISSDTTMHFPVGNTELIWIPDNDSASQYSCITNVIVIDTEAPVILECPRDTIHCGLTLDLAPPIVADNCEFSITNNIGNGSSIGLAFSHNTETEVIWTITDGTNEESCSTTVLAHDNSTPAIAGVDQELNAVYSTTIDALAPSSGIGYWTLGDGYAEIANDASNLTTITNLQTGTNTLVWNVESDVCGNSADELQVTVYDFLIPNAFSPNNDGFNDAFRVVGIETIPQNFFKVFNQWGRVVYSANNYDNQWDGKSNSGGELPSDTYYYIFEVKGDSPMNFEGYIELRR